MTAAFGGVVGKTFFYPPGFIFYFTTCSSNGYYFSPAEGERGCKGPKLAQHTSQMCVETETFVAMSLLVECGILIHFPSTNFKNGFKKG